MPDLRGLFLRGYGSQSHAQNNGSTVGVTSTTHASGALGQVQGDALRKITGYFSAGDMFFGTEDTTGVFTHPETADSAAAPLNYPTGKCDDLILDTSRVIPTANEIRPANVAVRYLVRARP